MRRALDRHDAPLGDLGTGEGVPQYHAGVTGLSEKAVRPYLLSAGCVVIAGAVRLLLDPVLESQSPFATFLLATLFAAWRWGLGPALASLTLGWWVGQFLFMEPRYTWVPPMQSNHVIAFALYFTVGGVSATFGHFARAAKIRSDTRSQIEAARLAAIVTSSEDAIISKDLNGIITTWNRGAERLFGYTSDEAIGQPVTMLMTAENLEEETRILTKVRRGESLEHHETVRRRKDGSLVEVSLTVSPLRSVTGEIIGASKIMRDVTERNRMEESRAKLASIVESSDDAIISKNLEGEITSWNAGAERLFGYTARDAIGKPIGMLLPDDRFNEDPEILGRIQRGESVEHYETVRRRKDGSLVDISLTVSPLRDGKGRLVGASRIVRDVTLSKKAQEDLRSSEAQARNALAAAEAASRAKDEFLAMLSHELRTPMAAIVGWSQMLREGATPEETQEGIEVIERNARLQSQIIEDLLDMSRIMSGKFRLNVESVDVDMVLRGAVDGVRLAAESKHLKLTVVQEGEPGEVRGDPHRLQQVFFNLLTNAVKFTPARGEVRVVCRHRQGHVEVGVTDTGIGIKPEFLPMVFERFKQQDGRITRQFQGLGLGLAIARHLVELHGGTIRAESVGEGRGATFTVELPRAIPRIAALSTGHEERRLRSGSGATSAAIVGAPPAKVLAGVTVMVTDDELDARDVVKRMLERRGAKVLTCGSAAETLERLARERPNILVCDIGMPEVDGYALIGKVRTSSPEQGGATPAIALTAFARPEDRTRALLAGFQMHMSKPVDPEELVAGIRRVAASV